MPLPETKVLVEVLKDGRWAQEPWLPQLVVAKGDKVSVSISIAHAQQGKGKCRIIPDDDVTEEGKKKRIPKQVKRKSEGSPAKQDKEDAEG